MAKRDKFHGRVENLPPRGCDWPECGGEGSFRAPRGKAAGGNAGIDAGIDAGGIDAGPDGDIDDSVWLCLDHVREYNAGWNYFEGMSEAEINGFRDSEAGWHRPTWPAAGTGPAAPRVPNGPWTGTGSFTDPHRLFPGAGHDGSAAPGFRRPLSLGDLQALNVLGLEEGASVADIKAGYKRLAKQHHPDLNHGDAASEERLRGVIEAYNRLSRAFADC